MAGVRVFAFEPFLLLPERQLLMRGGAAVAVGGRALDLLTALVERAGTVVSKADLIAAAWPTTTVDESNLKVNIAALRRVLGDDIGSTKFIATVTGRGYRFVAPVEVACAPNRRSTESDCPRPLPSTLERRASADFGLERVSGRLLAPTEDISEPPPSDPPFRSGQIQSQVIDLFASADFSCSCVSPIHALLDKIGYGIIVDGEMTLRLGDAVVLLKPGSVVARHDINRHSGRAASCRILFVGPDPPEWPSS